MEIPKPHKLKKWSPPACFECNNFDGISGMDILCRKLKTRVSAIDLKKCRNNNLFEEINGDVMFSGEVY